MSKHRNSGQRARARADADDRDAHAYRLLQAEALLHEAGYVPLGDGTWGKPKGEATQPSG